MSGKGFGRKEGAFGWDKGSNWDNNSWSDGWNDAPRTWTDKKWDEESAPENNKATRIVNKSQLTHEVVRPSCNSDGSTFVKKTQKMSDDKFLSEESMVAMMTPDNSHLLRRPGTDVSEVSASLCSAIEMLTHLKEDPSGPGLQDLQTLLTESDDFVTALGVLNKDNDMERDNDEVRESHPYRRGLCSRAEGCTAASIDEGLLFCEPSVRRYIQCPPAVHSVAEPTMVEHADPRQANNFENGTAVESRR